MKVKFEKSYEKSYKSSNTIEMVNRCIKKYEDTWPSKKLLERCLIYDVGIMIEAILDKSHWYYEPIYDLHTHYFDTYVGEGAELTLNLKLDSYQLHDIEHYRSKITGKLPAEDIYERLKEHQMFDILSHDFRFAKVYDLLGNPTSVCIGSDDDIWIEWFIQKWGHNV